MMKKNEIKLDRRNFFRKCLGSAKDTVFGVANEYIKHKFRRTFLRPPGALPEEEFVFACSRCNECVTACPYEAIHLIDDIRTPALHRTPFIDPKHQACQFCEDAPCVAACAEDALVLSSDGVLPKMGIAQVNPEHCLAGQGQRCDYCYKSCPKGINAIRPDDNGVPVIDEDACVGCGKCAYICVAQTGNALVISPI